MKKLCFLLLLLGCARIGSASHWDLEYWQFLRGQVYQLGPHGFYFSGELRLNDEISRVYYYRWSGNFSYAVLSYLTLESHYSFIYSRPLENGHFSITHRLEIEANPHKQFTNGLLLQWRNRVELNKRQGVGKINTVFRHRATASFPLHDRGSWQRIGASDEVFYSITQRRFTENRFVPFSTTFVIGRSSSIEPFLMIRTLFDIPRWHNSVVLGSNWAF